MLLSFIYFHHGYVLNQAQITLMQVQAHFSRLEKFANPPCATQWVETTYKEECIYLCFQVTFCFNLWPTKLGKTQSCRNCPYRINVIPLHCDSNTQTRPAISTYIHYRPLIMSQTKKSSFFGVSFWLCIIYKKGCYLGVSLVLPSTATTWNHPGNTLFIY